MVFLEETFRMVESRRNELSRQWPFLQSMCNVGWFKPLLFGHPARLKSVLDEELATDEERTFDQLLQSHYKRGHASGENRLLVPYWQRRETEVTLKELCEIRGPNPDLDKWRDEWDQSEEMKKENRGLLADLRSRHTVRNGETFADYYQSLADEAAHLLIHERLALAQADVK